MKLSLALALRKETRSFLNNKSNKQDLINIFSIEMNEKEKEYRYVFCTQWCGCVDCPKSCEYGYANWTFEIAEGADILVLLCH